MSKSKTGGSKILTPPALFKLVSLEKETLNRAAKILANCRDSSTHFDFISMVAKYKADGLREENRIHRATMQGLEAEMKKYFSPLKTAKGKK
jgi:hypothetical protein